LDNGHFEIGVHIADVSHYVRPGSAMDTEALRRSNSVYLVDRVVPMLPEQLSNIACSLRPNEDKYTFSAVFEIDTSGKYLLNGSEKQLFIRIGALPMKRHKKLLREKRVILRKKF